MKYIAACFLGSAFGTLGWLVLAERYADPVRCRVENTADHVVVMRENQALRAELFRLRGEVLDLTERLGVAAVAADAGRRAATAPAPADVADRDRIPPQAVPTR